MSNKYPTPTKAGFYYVRPKRLGRFPEPWCIVIELVGKAPMLRSNGLHRLPVPVRTADTDVSGLIDEITRRGEADDFDNIDFGPPFELPPLEPVMVQPNPPMPIEQITP